MDIYITLRSVIYRSDAGKLQNTLFRIEIHEMALTAL